MIDTVLRVLLLLAGFTIAFIFGMAIEGAIDNKAMVELKRENKKLKNEAREARREQKKVVEVLQYTTDQHGFDELYKPF